VTDDDFASWESYHVALFALAPEDAKTVATWRAALDEFSLAELCKASAELLRAAPKSFRNDHVPGFFKLLPARPKRREPAKFGSACPCQDCQRRKSGQPEVDNSDEPPSRFSFVRASKRYEEAKRKNDKVPF